MHSQHKPPHGQWLNLHPSLQIRSLLLPFLILITPFLGFLGHNSYCLSCPETLAIFGGLFLIGSICAAIWVVGWTGSYHLAIAALITFFITIQFDELQEIMVGLVVVLVLIWALKENFFFVATVVFMTFFIVTFVQAYRSHSHDTFHFSQSMPVPHRNSPPRLIHIILDEHIGMDGIPTDMSIGKAVKEQLTSFYRKYGFRLSAGAFSHYYDTHHSIPNALNFSKEDSPGAYVTSGPGSWSHIILRNSYFEVLAKMGYHIHVLSPQSMDYCSQSPVRIRNCYNYQAARMNAIADLEIPVSDKIRILWSQYLSQSDLTGEKLILTYEATRHVLATYGISLPPWPWGLSKDSLRMHSFNTVKNLDRVWERILSVPSGNAIFVHLLFPHYPYVANADCSIKNPMDWKNRFYNKSNLWAANTAEPRNVRYQLYFEQISCLYSELDRLFKQMQAAGVYEDSVVILHGDHGSRIVLNEPRARNQDSLTERDILDGFSTLFAVKMPGASWEYASSPQPLEQLMANVVVELTGVSPVQGQDKPANFVYLHDGKNTLVPIPYPRNH